MARCSLSVLVLLAALAGCDEKGPATTEPVRELKQLPMAQLRTMLKGYPGEWREDSDRARKRPVPPMEDAVPAGAKHIALVPPAQFQLGELSVREAIAQRRSTRDFSDAPLTLTELSFLLWATQGVTGEQKDEAGKVVQPLRAAPSGGGRYPLETYLALSRVEGLAPGLYRYRPSAHELLLLREQADFARQLQAACYGTPAVGEAAVVFVWSAVPYRSEWKYAYLAHRMIAMEAGHVCENLYLAGGACGLGVCALLSYHQPRVDELLGLDGQEEFALYLAAVGRPNVAEE